MKQLLGHWCSKNRIRTIAHDLLIGGHQESLDYIIFVSPACFFLYTLSGKVKIVIQCVPFSLKNKGIKHFGKKKDVDLSIIVNFDQLLNKI